MFDSLISITVFVLFVLCLLGFLFGIPYICAMLFSGLWDTLVTRSENDCDLEISLDIANTQRLLDETEQFLANSKQERAERNAAARDRRMQSEQRWRSKLPKQNQLPKEG